ncbi:hypothetical protein FQR65_LT07962 [Abscondita terminalis]|nr:hypothetical protein FQR65_LT07962 [Abscondita terminalis]
MASDEENNEKQTNKDDNQNESSDLKTENVHYEGDVAVYTDPSTNYQYTWSNDKQEWVARDNTKYGFEDDTHTYTDNEGVKYFWDKDKNAWFPKLDDEFMARYQLNYGFVDNTTKEEPKETEPVVPKEKSKPKQDSAMKRKAPPPEPTWFDIDDEHNTNVYVTNLPLSLTEEEFVELMQKAGLIMRDGVTGKMKIKLYVDPETKNFKGDALCTYIRVESVNLALDLLDGTDLKGNKIKIERAKFQMKGEFDPKLKPKKRRKKDKEKLRRMQEKLFDWRPEKQLGERAKHEKVVIVKNVFESSMFDVDVSLILEFQQDLREECGKCGTVKKVIIYDRHPEGIAQVNMKEPEEADAVVQLLNGRWFGKRKLSAEIWDGRTKFKIAETDSQITQRIEKWEKFLEDDESKGTGTLYIRRRSQLLRETERSPDNWRQYLRVRSQLLQQRYGNSLDSNSSLGMLTRSMSKVNSPNVQNTSSGAVIPTNKADASRALVGGTTIAENYAFVGVHHIFDQHIEAVTMVKFANNDRSRFCCSSVDTTLSICCVNSTPPTVISVLKGHTKAVTGFDWSANNDLIASASLDGTIKVWNVADNICLRSINDPTNSTLLCCLYNNINNNLLITGNGKGEVGVANVSTGLFMKNTCKIGGNIMSITSDSNGKVLWVGNDRGEIISLVCDMGGNLHKTRRLLVSASNTITSLSYRAWISREARDPMLLVNCTDNTVCLFRIIDQEGGLQLKRKFHNKHQKHFIKSTFCPIMSFRQGACIVTGSEDSCVYFVDIEKPVSRACVNTLQGHASPVLGVTFNYDESLLATGDLEGLVIVWKRAVLT